MNMAPTRSRMRVFLVSSSIMCFILLALARQPVNHYFSYDALNTGNTHLEATGLPAVGSALTPLRGSAADLLNLTASSSARVMGELRKTSRSSRSRGWRQLTFWVGNSSLLDGRAVTEGLQVGSQVGQADLIADIFGHARGGFFVDLVCYLPASNGILDVSADSTPFAFWFAYSRRLPMIQPIYPTL